MGRQQNQGEELQHDLGGDEFICCRLAWRIATAAEDRGHMRGERRTSAMDEINGNHRRRLVSGEDPRLIPRYIVERPGADGPGGKDLMGLKVRLGWKLGHRR